MPQGSVDENLLKEILGGGGGGAVSNTFSDALQFVENHLVALSNDQAQALSFLEVLGGRGKKYDLVIQAVLRYRALTGDCEPILRAIEAVALYNKFNGFSGSLVRERKVG